MSNLRVALVAQLQRFDDEAFVALANRGLLRRAQKELEKQSATVVDETAEALTLAFGEHRVRFDARGPAHAQCSCPASGVCQHILAAAISLQGLVQSPPAEPGQAAQLLVDQQAELQADLMRLDAAELTKHAGKAGYRWAWQFVQDLDPEHGLQISGERHLRLSFSHPRIGFRYLGGGLASLIADAELSQIEKYRVAAVLAYQRAHGAELTPAEAVGAARPRNAALDLGRDHALAETSQDAQHTSRERLRASARQLFGECVALGLAHLSRGIQERYATLAVWAQGAEYHRLALLLRRIADHVELLLERAGGADEHVLLDELSLAHGLVCALDQAAATQASPAHLIGRARSRYEEGSALELLGLGASAWRSPAGYVGLTLLFWSPADAAFFSCSDARPEGQRGFDPIARYKAAGPWSGLGAPAQATGRRLVLSGVQINAAGRLSAADSTSATLGPGLAAEAFAGQLQPWANWSSALQQRAQARQSLLAEPQPMKDWVVLKPTRFGKPAFDSTRQTLVWPLFDDEDRRLDAELPFDKYNQHAMQRIEQLRDDELVPGTLVVGRLQPGAGGVTLAPLSLVRARAVEGCNPVDSLHFDAATEQGFAARWLSKVRRAGAAEQAAPMALAPSPIPPLLREHRHGLQRLAERGVSADQAEQVRLHLSAAATRAGEAGFTAFQRLRAPAGPELGAALLQSHYLCMQYERLLDDADLNP